MNVCLDRLGGRREVGSEQDPRSLLRELTCDVLLLDINLPGRNGIEALTALIEEGRAPRTVVLSQYPEDQYGIRALKSGAMAYLNKAVTPQTIVQAVLTVAAGRKFVTAEIANALMENVGMPNDRLPHEVLSEREMQTMLRIARGQKLAQMAEELVLSTKTVSVYRARVLEKLGLSNNSELTVYAIRNGLVGGG